MKDWRKRGYSSYQRLAQKTAAVCFDKVALPSPSPRLDNAIEYLKAKPPTPSKPLLKQASK
jgi:ABC-type protease/lipase transport system fused ATPase/permease subunit